MIDELKKLSIAFNQTTTINRRQLATTRNYNNNMINILIDKIRFLITIMIFKIDRICKND